MFRRYGPNHSSDSSIALLARGTNGFVKPTAQQRTDISLNILSKATKLCFVNTGEVVLATSQIRVITQPPGSRGEGQRGSELT